MKLHCAYAILIRTRVKVVTQVRIQSRWLIFAIFLTGAISLLIGLTYYKSIKSVDLSGYSVNQISLNHGFNQKGFVVNKKIKLDRYTFYNDKNHKDFTVKVKNKTHKVKLGENYKINKVGKNYHSMTYVDRFNKLKLNILYKDNIVKRIEFFSK